MSERERERGRGGEGERGREGERERGREGERERGRDRDRSTLDKGRWREGGSETELSHCCWFGSGGANVMVVLRHLRREIGLLTQVVVDCFGP